MYGHRKTVFQYSLFLSSHKVFFFHTKTVDKCPNTVDNLIKLWTNVKYF